MYYAASVPSTHKVSQRVFNVCRYTHTHVCLQVRDQARRFITLVDELYNARTRLVCLAACPPDALFGSVVNEEPLLDLEGLQFETAVEGEQLSANSRVQSCSLLVKLTFPPGGKQPKHNSGRADWAAAITGSHPRFAQI